MCWTGNGWEFFISYCYWLTWYKRCTPVVDSSTMPFRCLATAGNFDTSVCVASPPSSRIRLGCQLSLPVKRKIGKSTLGMAIPRRISFLEESRSRRIAKLHSSGIEEYDIYSSGSSGNFRGMSYPKNPEKPQKIQIKKIQPWIYISKFRILGNNTKNWLVIQKNKNKNWKILTNFWKFSPFFHI